MNHKLWFITGWFLNCFDWLASGSVWWSLAYFWNPSTHIINTYTFYLVNIAVPCCPTCIISWLIMVFLLIWGPTRTVLKALGANLSLKIPIVEAISLSTLLSMSLCLTDSLCIFSITIPTFNFFYKSDWAFHGSIQRKSWDIQPVPSHVWGVKLYF